MHKRYTRWLAAILLGLMVVFVTPALAQEHYSDSTGTFSTEIPAGWDNESTADYGLFTRDGIAVYMLSAASGDVQSGIEAAIQSVISDFDTAPVASSELPAPNGVWIQNVYAYSDGRLQVALAQVDGNVTYVLFINLPDQAALMAKQGEINSILLSASVGAVIDLSDQQPETLDEAALAAISSYVDDAMGRYGIIGATVAIVENGEVVYSEGFGNLGMDDATPVSDETLFMIGSTTKSMTTMMTATLVDDGILDWDTPVTDILPDFTLSESTAAAQIELRDLFNMSSGIPRYDIPLSLQTYTPAGVEQEIAAIPLAAQPGQSFHYSNFMVALGGFADAVAAGADLSEAAGAYGDLMQAQVFDPIGMSSTTLDFEAAQAIADRATPYREDLTLDELVEIPIDAERFVTGVAPAGAVWSNADDMARYMITQMNGGVAPDGTRVVSEENLFETWTPQIDMGNGTAYGMGWMIGTYKGQRIIQHGGNTSGFTSDFGFLPDAGLGVVVLSNVGLANNFGMSVREYVFETAFGLEHSADAIYAAAERSLKSLFDQILATVDYSEAPVDPQTVADYLGSYERGVEIAIDDEGNLVAKTAYIDLILLPTNDPDEFVGSGVTAAFREDASGEVSMTIDSLFGPAMGEPQSLTLDKVE